MQTTLWNESRAKRERVMPLVDLCSPAARNSLFTSLLFTSLLFTPKIFCLLRTILYILLVLERIFCFSYGWWHEQGIEPVESRFNFRKKTSELVNFQLKIFAEDRKLKGVNY